MKKFNANKALRNDERIYGPLEKVLNYIFYEILYRPIIDIVNSEITAEWSILVAPEVIEARKRQKIDDLRAEIKRNREVIPEAMRTNAKDKKSALVDAILSGRVQYVNDHFEGTFSSSISREIKSMGGKFDSRRKQWRITSKNLSYDTQLAIGQVSDKVKRLQEKISNYLDVMNRMLERGARYKLERYYSKAINELDGHFVDGIKDIMVAPELTDGMRDNLAKMYTENMSLYINKWAKKSIVRLRKRVEKNAINGYRASNLVEELEHDYQMSHNKAKFLARQETSLLMSQFREERYKSIGINEYTWSTSGDSRVRPMHKRLHGKVFSWDNPPIVDESGRRAHPGQDFGCRCLAIPKIR
ncbi:MAG: minor capsid protein [Methanobrevibacter sp.]|nr:minor capsid protein [Methanobrevibacter sp.]